MWIQMKVQERKLYLGNLGFWSDLTSLGYADLEDLPMSLDWMASKRGESAEGQTNVWFILNKEEQHLCLYDCGVLHVSCQVFLKTPLLNQRTSQLWCHLGHQYGWTACPEKTFLHITSPLESTIVCLLLILCMSSYHWPSALEITDFLGTSETMLTVAKEGMNILDVALLAVPISIQVESPRTRGASWWLRW